MAIFNAAEIIDMGIEKEKKRRDFYGLAAEKFVDKAMKSLFARLRDWEAAHIVKFTEIRKSVEEDETFESYPGELIEYMKTLVDNKLYKEVSPQNFTKIVKAPLDAIKYGMVFEKDAILFFNELAPYMSADNKEKIQKLVDEEKTHLIYLSELKKKYERPSD